jgi:hypothetical protein
VKQKDILLIVVVVAISGGVSLFISSLLFKTPKAQETKVEVVQPITAQFVEPDPRYFNSTSIDPTQNINIGDNQNPTPFNDKKQ